MAPHYLRLAGAVSLLILWIRQLPGMPSMLTTIGTLGILTDDELRDLRHLLILENCSTIISQGGYLRTAPKNERTFFMTVDVVGLMT